MNPMMQKKNSGVIQNGAQPQMGVGNMQIGQDPRVMQSKQFPMSNKNIMRQGTNPNAMGSMNGIRISTLSHYIFVTHRELLTLHNPRILTYLHITHTHLRLCSVLYDARVFLL